MNKRGGIRGARGLTAAPLGSGRLFRMQLQILRGLHEIEAKLAHIDLGEQPKLLWKRR
jgi:hypothetical protein